MLLGLILAVFIAPIIIIKNQATIGKMKRILEAARHMPKADTEAYQRKRRSLLSSLYDLKSTIVADNRALIEADDLIERFKFITG